MNPRRLQELLYRHRHGTLSPEEWEEVRDYVLNGQYDEVISKDIQEIFSAYGTHEAWTEELEQDTWSKVASTVGIDEEVDLSPRLSRSIWRPLLWGAAATLVIVLSLSIFFQQGNAGKMKKQGSLAVELLREKQAPRASHAVLTLGDGRQILLDQQTTGTVTSQGGISLVKLADGRIAYQGNSGAVMYNTLQNPRGSRVVAMTLSDGTRIWLNSESSIRYPNLFTGNERQVEITGEAYFEVAHDPNKEFIVSSGNVKTEVLGTHFNVNAYRDDGNTKITLLEGSVRVTSEHHETTLVPGQQAEVNGDVKLVAHADLDEAMAWKNGKFQFGEAMDIVTAMKQISRWYDVNIECSGNFPGHIGGTISRTVNFSEILKMIEMTGTMKYHTDGNKIIVTH